MIALIIYMQQVVLAATAAMAVKVAAAEAVGLELPVVRVPPVRREPLEIRASLVKNNN